MDLYKEIAYLKYRLCLLEKAAEKSTQFRTNGVKNPLQSILDLVNSDTVDFEYLVDGKVQAKVAAGSGGIGADIQVVDHFSDIGSSTVKRFIYVIVDETNNNDSSLYVYIGTGLKFLLTVP